MNEPFRQLPRSLRVFWWVNVVLSLAAFAASLAHPSWSASMFGNDLMVYAVRFTHFHNQSFFAATATAPFAYPAPMSLLYWLFYLVPYIHGVLSPVRIFLAVTLGLILILAAMLCGAMRRQGIDVGICALWVGSILVVSYPFWFEFLLCNMEVMVFLALAFATVLFLRGRTYAAGTLIGIATALKIYPFIFFALFLSRRKYKEIAVGVGVAAALDIVSLWLVSGSIVAGERGINAGLAWNRLTYMLHYRVVETTFDHSIMGLIKRLGYMWGVISYPGTFLTVYLALAAAVGIMLYWFRIRHMPVLNQTLALFVAAVLFPPTSHDYTLIELYIPWGLFVLYGIADWTAHRRSAPGLMAVFVCFSILFSTLPESTFGGQIRAVVLIVLFVISLRCPFEYSAPQEVSLPGSNIGYEASCAPVL